MTTHTFKIGMGALVATPHLDSEELSGERIRGTVLARSQHNDGRCDQYLVRYHDHNGVEREDWFAEDRLN